MVTTDLEVLTSDKINLGILFIIYWSIVGSLNIRLLASPGTLLNFGYACLSTKFQINPLCVSNHEVNTKKITLF